MAEDKKVTTDVVTDDVKDEDIEDLDESKIDTADYIKKLKAEAKSYRLGKAALKKEFEDTKAKLDALEAAKLTETEKDKNKIIDLEKKLVDIQTEYKYKEIDNLILTVASSKNFNDLEIVKMLVKKELESEEEVNNKVIEKIVDKIIKDKPYLISSGTVNPSFGNFGKKDMEGKKDINEMFGEMIKKRL